MKKFFGFRLPISKPVFSVVVSLAFGCLINTNSLAHEGEHKQLVLSNALQHAASALPDRVILTWSGDPTNSIDVTWRTQLGVKTSIVEYAKADLLRGSLPDGNVPFASKQVGKGSVFESSLGKYRLHTAKLEELESSTMYAYRVGDGERWSEWFQFQTASKAPKPFTFVYFGDAQNAVRSMWSRVIREANQHAPRSAFLLHAGDLVNRGNNDAEWGEWFGAGGWLNGMIPSVATPGNHEYRDGVLSRHWRPQFSFPLNGPSGLEETAYWFDYQGARVISLNSNEDVERQKAWLEAVLKDPNRPKWTICTFHHPIFSAAKERDNPRLRSAWRDVIEEQGVDLVLQGHDHAYARSGLGGPKNVSNVAEGARTGSSGTVYVVSVSGPKMYPLQVKWDVERVASGIQLFQVIKVSAESIEYEARIATGELYDAFTLVKDEEGNRSLIERKPETPEVRAR